MIGRNKKANNHPKFQLPTLVSPPLYSGHKDKRKNPFERCRSHISRHFFPNSRRRISRLSQELFFTVIPFHSPLCISIHPSLHFVVFSRALLPFCQEASWLH
ncbi:hypothetical protein CDAR_487731 [Caerostris darwini]|uniref:Uncharacterized protein n=1 Tax=Caerostris darwini TaxID=1538125 RepID=A0AAV4PU14_9ARAC|nr:hypothetical protein CDAR_487731 [Caerostris darwini]